MSCETNALLELCAAAHRAYLAEVEAVEMARNIGLPAAVCADPVSAERAALEELMLRTDEPGVQTLINEVIEREHHLDIVNPEKIRRNSVHRC